MADLYEYNTDTGLIIPQTSDLKTQTQAEFQAAFGSNLSLVDSTPQGVLIQNITDLKSNVISANATMANGLNIFYAKGIQLDAIGLNFGVVRRTNQSTLVDALIQGVPDTIIPAGSIAQTTAGDNFISVYVTTIGVDGRATVRFASQESGAVPCPLGSLTTIVSQIDGWETITNIENGVLGYDAESDYSYRLRIFKEYQKSAGFMESFYARLNEVSDMQSQIVLENPTSATQIVQGVPINAHSVAIIVDGGTDEDVAKAIFDAKDAGCGYTAITETYPYGWIRFENMLSNGDTITIGSDTFVAGEDFHIGTSVQEMVNNIVSEVTVSGVVLTSNPKGNQLDVRAEIAGAMYNGIALACSNGIVSGTTVGNGFDNTDVSVTETVTDVYDIANTVIFNRPYVYRVGVKAVIKSNLYTGSDLKGEVESAILLWASNAVEGVEGITIGSNINAWEIASAITLQIPACQISSVYVGMASGERAFGIMTFANNLQEGDTITIGSTVLTAGTDFEIGSTTKETLENVASLEVPNVNLSQHGINKLQIIYKYVGTIGNSLTLASTAVGASITAMQGGTDNVINSLEVDTGVAIIGHIDLMDIDVVVV